MLGGLNSYSYVFNNPLNWRDPLGLKKTQGGLGGSVPFLGGFEVGIFVTDGVGDLGGNPDAGLYFTVSKPLNRSILETGIGKLKLEKLWGR